MNKDIASQKSTKLVQGSILQEGPSFIVKNNFFINIEELRVDGTEDVNPLTTTDTQIIATAFKMVHQLNETRMDYDAETVFQLNLDEFCQMWGIVITDEDKKNGGIYHNIINSVTRLQKRLFRYPDPESGQFAQSGYFAYITYKNKVLSFGFPKPFIAHLKKMNEFTWYYFENVINLINNAYSLPLASYSTILYENLQKKKYLTPIDENGYRAIRFEVGSLKKILATPKSYQNNGELRRKVLNSVIDNIHKSTDLKVELHTITSGRTITHFNFLCKFPETDLDFDYAVSKKKKEKPLLTAAQRKRFAPLLAKSTDFLSIYGDHSTTKDDKKQFVKKLEKDLMEPVVVFEYWKYLKVVGCTSKKIDKLVYGHADENEDPQLKF